MKKILVISDLHFDSLMQHEEYQNIITDFTDQLSEFVQGNKVEGIIIAGDLSIEPHDISQFFQQLTGLEIPKVYVPGEPRNAVRAEFLEIDVYDEYIAA